MVLFICNGVYSDVVGELRSGLLAYYSFDGADLAQDYSGNGHHGVNSGAITVKGGVSGSMAYFDGGSKIVVPAFKTYKWGDSLTVSFWFKPTQSPNDYSGLVNNGYAATGGWEIRMEPKMNGKVQTIGAGVASVAGPEIWDIRGVPVAVRVWHHVAVTYDGSEVVLILDGEKHENDDDDRGPIMNKSLPVTIGQCGPQHRLSPEYFTGLIDEVRIYNRVLSIAEVEQLRTQVVANNAESGINHAGADDQETAKVVLPPP